MIRRIGKPVLWLLLALPGAMMLAGLMRGQALAMDLLHPSGELAVRLMILALLPGPLSEIFRGNQFLKFWLAIRRNLGISAFAYALLHLAFYVMDMASAGGMLDELGIPSIWTGWLALTLMIPPAAISFDAAMRALGRQWKRVQTLVYLALLAGMAHWLLLDWEWQPAAVHLAPLILVWSLRGLRRLKSPKTLRTLS